MVRNLKRALGRRLRALATLNSPAEVFAFLRIFLLATVFTAFLRLKLSKPLLTWLSSRQVGKGSADRERLRQIARRTDTALLLGRPMIRSECLSRTCLLYYQMKRAGADVDMRFGVNADTSSFKYHCWLLVDGEPTYEPSDPGPKYQPLYDLHG